ncbi:DUF6879 family protein [Nocardia harenae]|uniref:DUF6879 family protein n=1 Tax=Nocardia harenae TaxID=358707 RepID=UPI0008319DEE|nr:DUF6879 family protein [Nocardia harenae]
MLLVEGEDFLDLFRAAKREAFHLENSDIYETPDESEPLRKFLAGEPDDYQWFTPWMDHVRETTARGVSVRRARIVTEPHTDYTRFAKAVARLNEEAGEDVRYAGRHLFEPHPVRSPDWWLFDGGTLAYTVFEPSGRWAGAAVTTDPVLVEYAQGTRELVWSLATPLRSYAAQ